MFTKPRTMEQIREQAVTQIVAVFNQHFGSYRLPKKPMYTSQVRTLREMLVSFCKDRLGWGISFSFDIRRIESDEMIEITAYREESAGDGWRQSRSLKLANPFVDEHQKRQFCADLLKVFEKIEATHPGYFLNDTPYELTKDEQ